MRRGLKLVWVGMALAVALTMGPGVAQAQRALLGESLVEYVRGRDDLPAKERRVWEREVRKKFGGAALKEDSQQNVEISVAKAILSAAIFMQIEPKRAVAAAWEGWRGALGFVPPPIAIHYEILSLEGRKPRGRPIDLAFDFPDYYNEEIAPDLVAYWEEALAAGKISDAALAETIEALEATRVKMRPLLADKLRLLAALDRDLRVLRGVRRAELERDMNELEGDLARAFKNVARRPEVLDRRRRPYDRLRLELEDSGAKLTDDDRLLDPDLPPTDRSQPPTPRSQEPTQEPKTKLEPEPESKPESKPGTTPEAKPEPAQEPELPLTEPDEPPPIPPLPPQRRAGEPESTQPDPFGRPVAELVLAYRAKLETTVVPWLGTPYRWGGDAPRTGTDCSGFTRGVTRDGFSVGLPRVSRDQYLVGRSVSRDALKPGDLVFFDIKDVGRVSHVGIYAGGGRFAHASTTRGVVYDDLQARYYLRAFRGARRVLAYPSD